MLIARRCSAKNMLIRHMEMVCINYDYKIRDELQFTNKFTTNMYVRRLP